MQPETRSHLAKPVSLADLSRHVNLAVGTVSRALNGNKRVNEKTRARIMAAADALGYRPNPLARGLLNGRTGLVGLMFFMNSPARNLVISSQLYFFQKLLQEQGKRSLVEFTALGYPEKLRAIEDFLAMRAEGIIHIGPFPPELLATFATLRERGVPYVLLNPSGINLPFSVSLNHVAVYEKITDHLLDLGHRKFVLLGMLGVESSPNLTSYYSRIQGVRHSLARRGLIFEKCVKTCFLPPQPLEPAGELGHRLARHFYHDLSECTACLASNDDVALGAMHFLRSKGCRIPQDLSVVGFDDSAPYSDPALSTVSQELEKSTKTAISMFLTAGTHGMTREIPPVTIEPTFIPRESTGRAPAVSKSRPGKTGGKK